MYIIPPNIKHKSIYIRDTYKIRLNISSTIAPKNLKSKYIINAFAKVKAILLRGFVPPLTALCGESQSKHGYLIPIYKSILEK